MDRSGAPGCAWFLCLVYICLYFNNCIDPNLGDGTKSPIMMCCFAQNDISMLLNFYFWQPVYYLIDPEDQSFSVKSREKRVRWTGVDENIGAKICYKLVDEESGKIICRSVIQSTTEADTAILQIDPIKPLPPPDAMLDEIMTAADFKTPVSSDNKKDPVDSTPASKDTMNWREMEQSNQVEHQEDIQQRNFNYFQPKFCKQQHRYQSRSKTPVYGFETVAEIDENRPVGGKEFIFFRDNGEKEPVCKQFEFIL